MVVRQFRRDDGERYLLLIQEPVTQRGQGYLLEGTTCGFTTLQQAVRPHFLKETFQDSDVRNADFSSTSWSSSYEVEGYYEGTLGSFDVHIIELKAVDDTVPFLRHVVGDQGYQLGAQGGGVQPNPAAHAFGAVSQVRQSGEAVILCRWSSWMSWWKEEDPGESQ